MNFGFRISDFERGEEASTDGVNRAMAGDRSAAGASESSTFDISGTTRRQQ
jgi:hypothetical protein